MKVTGLITEYNPFHQGHEYHIAESRRITEADYVIVVMSGDYVQRGTPAILSKHKRAEMALLHGADLVLELPVAYATASAEQFAFGAVSLLEGLGVTDSLSFGSEYGSIAPFLAISQILLQEPDPYQNILKQELSGGSPFPAARAAALLACKKVAPKQFPLSEEALTQFLAAPNNILGLEYCKALLRLHSTITPYTLPRRGSGYHNTALREYASATGIRKELLDNPDWIILSVVLPREIYRILQEEYGRTLPLAEDDFSLLLAYRLMEETPDSLCDYLDISPELANRMKKQENACSSFSQFADLLKTREVTRTRVNRALLHLLLGIKKNQIYPISYTRVLGMKQSAAPLLRAIKEKGHLPLLTKLADADQMLSAKGLSMLSQEVFASNLYERVLCRKFGKEYQHEYQKPVIIL